MDEELCYNVIYSGAVEVVMLSDDRKNRELALEQGIPSFSVAEYVKNMPDFPSLADKLKLKDSADSGYGKKFLFPEHLSPSQVVFQCKLR
jgi:exosome complex exonuclease DIS3/RRP44